MAELPTGVSDVLLHRLHFMHHHIHFFHITHERVLSLPNCPPLDSLTDGLYNEPYWANLIVQELWEKLERLKLESSGCVETAWDASNNKSEA